MPSISALPDISKVAASNSPERVMFLKVPASLFASTTTALEASTVPAVIPSSCSSSDSAITAEPIVNPAAVTTPLISTAPLISTVVALISISVSDTKSKTPSAL